MKRCIVSILLIFLFALPLGATTIPSGTGAYGIKFTTTQMGIYADYGVQCIAFKFFDADASLEFFLSGVRVDSTFQLEGSAVTYTTPCDSINVTRAGITAGVYLIGSKDGSKCPELHSSIESDSSLTLADSLQTLTEATNTALGAIETDIEVGNDKFDSLIVLSNAPEPRAYVISTMLFQAVDSTHMDGGNAYPKGAGANISGARGLYILLDWINFDAGTFVAEIIIGTTGTAAVDTLYGLVCDELTAVPMEYTFANASWPDTGGVRIYLKGIYSIYSGSIYVRLSSTDVPGDFKIDGAVGVVW